MRFILWSVGKICRRSFTRCLVLTAIGTTLILSLGGCALSGTSGSSAAESSTQELSVLEDQKAIAELRKNIPEQKRQENDLLKETLNLMGDGTQRPEVIRDRHQKNVRKMQDEHRRTTQKARDQFNKAEKKSREAFTKNQEDARKDFRSEKPDRERSKEFYDDLELKRKDFFANQREKRQDFESTQKQLSDDFRAMIRQKNMEFDEEYRNYVKRYHEAEKSKRDQSKVRNNGGAVVPKTNYEPLQSGQQPAQ